MGGELGFAVGSEMNEVGEIWWFVLMKETENKLRAGWINRDAERGAHHDTAAGRKLNHWQEKMIAGDR